MGYYAAALFVVTTICRLSGARAMTSEEKTFTELQQAVSNFRVNVIQVESDVNSPQDFNSLRPPFHRSPLLTQRMLLATSCTTKIQSSSSNYCLDVYFRGTEAGTNV